MSHRSGSARRRRRKVKALETRIAALQQGVKQGDGSLATASAALHGMVRLMGVNPTMIAINAYELEALLKLVNRQIDGGRRALQQL